MNVPNYSETLDTRSMFFDSQMAIAGKSVFQSRYDVSTTNWMALCWNASQADRIRKPLAIQANAMQITQNILFEKQK